MIVLLAKGILDKMDYVKAMLVLLIVEPEYAKTLSLQITQTNSAKTTKLDASLQVKAAPTH